ncbi:N-6 DNA methylase [Methanobrevibacter sp.]|uniref:N-6 DNA methylase n=1 Tax=Methanobrevibacter sp. TaxID=66852 RepID=UPI00388D27D0
MLNYRYSNNRAVLKEIISKSRTAHFPLETQYLIIYAFIYKYCSDSLKDHFLMVLQEREVTLDEAYERKLYEEEFKNDAYHMYGYYIEKSYCYFDEVINDRFESETFLKDFFEAFSENVSFPKSSGDEKYLNQIFDAVREEFPFELFAANSENTQLLKDIIRLISKLNVFDTDFSFSDVFYSVADSRLLKIKSNPEYIYQILSAILASQKKNLENVYDPFMRDGTSLLSLSNLIGLWQSNNFGKEEDRVTYCYTIARLFLSYYSFNGLFIENEDAMNSADINQASFDGILSVIPIRIRNYHSSKKNQSLEIVKRHKRAQLEDVLSKNFDMDLTSFSKDAELNKALEKLINKMDVEKESASQFSGEYEILKESEFLFLINLVNSLKNNGIMAISISQNFLSKESLKTIRKYLALEKNYIDAIISIPNEFGRYKKPEVVIVFRKDKPDDKILFIDMSREFDTKRGRLMVPGLFKRNLLLSDDTIGKMIDVLSNRINIEKYSKVVSCDEIISNDFNLSVSMYVDTFEGQFINLRDLEYEKREIDMKRKDLDYKIDVMMRELNIK